MAFHERVSYISVRRQELNLGLVNQMCQDNSDTSLRLKTQTEDLLNKKRSPDDRRVCPKAYCTQCFIDHRDFRRVNTNPNEKIADGLHYGLEVLGVFFFHRVLLVYYIY